MDRLYNEVLASCPPTLRKPLHCVLSAIVTLEYPTIATLSDLLGQDVSDVLLVAHRLGAIVAIEELPTLPPIVTEFPVPAYLSPIVSFPDFSWVEFFTDKVRAGYFWVDRDAAYQTLLRRADYLLSRSISLSPIPMHCSTWTAIFHYLIRLWAEDDDESPPLWKDYWPLFAEELTRFQLADPAQQKLVASNPQSVRTFRLLLRCCKEQHDTGDDYLSKEGVNFRTAQFVVAVALREWFEDQSPDSKGIFDITSYLSYSETSMWTETVQEISEQPHLSWDIVLQIINQSRGLIDLDTGNPNDLDDPASRALRVCVDWSLMDVIEESSVIGSKLFVAYREVRIRALRDAYEDFLNEEDPVALQRKALGLFQKPMRNPYILTLNPDFDDGVASSLSILIDRIHSPQSLAVLLGPDLAFLGCHTLFIPFMTFVTLNCQKASTLGPSFGDLHRKSKDLFVTLIQNGALAAAFSHPDYHDSLQQRLNITLYRTISNLEGFDQGQWLDLIDCTTHTTIVEFFLGHNIVECFYGCRHSCAAIEWLHHFREATVSLKIIHSLVFLRLDLQCGGSKVISKYKPLLSSGSFLAGLKLWQEKYNEHHSDGTMVLEDLCALLSSIDWLSIASYDEQSEDSNDEDMEEETGEDNQNSDANHAEY